MQDDLDPASEPRIGRPTLYDPEYDEQVRKLALLGLTNDQLARFFGVAVSTMLNWSRDYPSFRKSLYAGREIADAEVANSLYKRAIGTTVRRKKVAINNQGVVTEHNYDEEVLPDVTAAQFWLTARQSQRWRAVTSLQHLDEDGNPMKPPSVTVVGLDPDRPTPEE